MSARYIDTLDYALSDQKPKNEAFVLGVDPGPLPEMPPGLEDAPELADDDETEALEQGRNEVPRMGGKAPTYHYVTGKEVGDAFGAVTAAWLSRIPIRHLTMLAGPQGTGKTKFGAYLISVFTGVTKYWPDGAVNEYRTGPVVVVETESMRGKILEITRHLGVPDNMLIFPCINPDDPYYTPQMPKDFAMVEAIVKETGAVAVIMDSLSGAHGGDENDASMRKILKPLSDMAARLDVPVIVVHHARKKGANDGKLPTLDQVRGSSAITQFCRSVFGLWRLDEQDTGAPIRVSMLKSTFWAPAKPFGMTLGDVDLTFGPAPEADRPVTKLDVAIAFLQAQLGREPQRYDKLLSQAEVLGVTKDALYRARDSLHIITVFGTWSLPAKDPTDIYIANDEKERMIRTPESAETSE